MTEKTSEIHRLAGICYSPIRTTSRLYSFPKRQYLSDTHVFKTLTLVVDCDC